MCQDLSVSQRGGPQHLLQTAGSWALKEQPFNYAKISPSGELWERGVSHPSPLSPGKIVGQQLFLCKLQNCVTCKQKSYWPSEPQDQVVPRLDSSHVSQSTRHGLMAFSGRYQPPPPSEAKRDCGDDLCKHSHSPNYLAIIP